MKPEKLLERILGGSLHSVDFEEMVRLVRAFGFHLDHVRGSHQLFFHPRIPEMLNLQTFRNQAKPYQIRQFLDLIERYNLRLEDR